jgi:hypothetical protein
MNGRWRRDKYTPLFLFRPHGVRLVDPGKAGREVDDRPGAV